MKLLGHFNKPKYFRHLGNSRNLVIICRAHYNILQRQGGSNVNEKP